jgi:CO/xanthine dehydrogenase FAD-binding subunit
MILFDFQYERAQSMKEAARLLAQCGADARIMAGGTDLLPNMRVAVTRPATVVGLGGIAPDAPRIEADGFVQIDALMRLAAIAESDFLRRHVPMLVEAAHVVASNQIRNMGTLGGNLCQDTRCLYFNQKHDYQFVVDCYKRGGNCCYPFPNNKPDVCWSVYMSDVTPALIALGAEIVVVDQTGSRRLPLEQVFTGNGIHPRHLKNGELIEAVLVPPASPRFGWGYHKSARRGGLEFAISVSAVALRLSADGCCEDARIVIGAVREKPVRALAAERMLKGQSPDEALLAAVAAKTGEEISPLPHHGFTKSFIVDNLRVHLRRILDRALERARAQSAAT